MLGLKGPTIYEVCGPVFRGRAAPHEPGRSLALLWEKALNHPLLKNFMLRWCGHSGVDRTRASRLRGMLQAALEADHARWGDEDWIRATFRPLADLLDETRTPEWQQRAPLPPFSGTVEAAEIDQGIETVMEHVFRVWDQDPADPHFPLAAEVLLSGDDHMDGQGLLDVLTGLGSVEYRNITMLFALARAWLMACPKVRSLTRRPHPGICEPLLQPMGWIMHRTAFYDVIFFEQLHNRLTKNDPPVEEARRIVWILESLLHYILVTSKEWLTTPSGMRHPAVTCLPKDEQGKPLCSMKDSDWQKKKELGFDDYVPDVDTTFLGLAMARKWLDLVAEGGIGADADLLAECRSWLDHPWPEIIGEYQIGEGMPGSPPSITMGNPLDFDGSVPLWFHKSFRKPDGRVITEVLGNEVCAGHNMDILECLLLNRREWNSLEGKNLDRVRRFLAFHHKAFISGNFQVEGAVRFYPVPVYVNYAGRLYETWLDLSEEEKALVDPGGKVEEIRGIALDWLRDDCLGRTFNPFDAALGVAALVLLRCGAPERPALERGVRLLLDRLGEGKSKDPYKAYEWTLVRYPARILVGSPAATSLFAMNALAEARHYLDSFPS